MRRRIPERKSIKKKTVFQNMRKKVLRSKEISLYMNKEDNIKKFQKRGEGTVMGK